jgi:predicted enzyme related to lactoylglutathione lyase
MSLQVNPVNWFEIPVSDMRRGTKFYEAAFGVKLAPNEMGPLQFAFFPMERGAAGAGGTLVEGEGYVPSHQGSMVYFRVEAIDAALKRIVKAGGKTLLPRTSIGQYGFIAHFEDTEGNRAALHEAAQG